MRNIFGGVYNILSNTDPKRVIWVSQYTASNGEAPVLESVKYFSIGITHSSTLTQKTLSVKAHVYVKGLIF